MRLPHSSSVVSVISAFVMPLLLVMSARAAGDQARFVRSFWFRGHGNNFRVNSPDTAEGKFADRPEAKKDGRMVIEVTDDLMQVASAELYLELWGGHPGVAHKRFTLNGRGTYKLPEVGAAEENCTYSYPVIPLKLSELNPGENVLQFTCDKGQTFWGHYLIRAACVRLTLKDTHSLLRQAGLRSFSAQVEAKAEGEAIRLGLAASDTQQGKIAAVDYWACYVGYDENGDGRGGDWHGFTLDSMPVANAARAVEPPFDATWDVSMVPDQKSLGVRAEVSFVGVPDLCYVTAPATVVMPARAAGVRLMNARELPKPFWSRAGRKQSCVVRLEADPATIEKAQLHVVVWEGGRGKVAHPLSLNGVALPTPTWRGAHELIYSVLDVDPAILKKGDNTVELLSDTDHHGIEVCLPGPAMIVRFRPALPGDTRTRNQPSSQDSPK